MRIGRYLPGIGPDEYRAMTLYDRACLNDALDALLDRENGKGDPVEEERKEEEREYRVDEEARRAARLSFDGWRDEGDDAAPDEED